MTTADSHGGDATRTGAAARLAGTLLVGATSVLACAAPAPDGASTGSATQPVQLAYQVAGSNYYAVDLALKDANARASGTVLVPVRDANNVVQTVATATGNVPLRRVCGVTFVSNSFAITAAHCVDATQLTPDAGLIVQMYRPKSTLPWLSATGVWNDYPDYAHNPLDASNGYLLAQYRCRVVMRCGDAWGPLACPPGHENADIALLQCPSVQPGCDHGQINVAKVDVPDAPVQIAWAHEVYDLTASPASMGGEHYALAPPTSDLAQNYHFFGYNTHQLLPLVSTTWPRPTPGCLARLPNPQYSYSSRFELGSEVLPVDGGFYREVRWTELLGCQDTAGAGVVQRDTSGAPALLGPVAVGNFATYAGGLTQLCHDPAEHSCDPSNSQGLGYTPLAHTQAVFAAVTDLGVACNAQPLPKLALWLTSDALRITQVARGTADLAPWPVPGATASAAWDVLRLYDEPMANLAAGAELTVPGSGFAYGVRYRASVRVRALGRVPPRVTLALGGQVLVRSVTPVPVAGESAGAVSVGFTAATTASALPLRVITDAEAGAAGVTEVTVVQDGAANGFDSRVERDGLGLLPAFTVGHPSPMRFQGSDSSRFVAELSPGERLVVTRQALLPGQIWTASFRASVDTRGMTCGFVFADGTEARVACDSVSGAARARVVPLASAQPVAFVIDLPSTAPGAVAIDDLALASIPGR